MCDAWKSNLRTKLKPDHKEPAIFAASKSPSLQCRVLQRIEELGLGQLQHRGFYIDPNPPQYRNKFPAVSRSRSLSHSQSATFLSPGNRDSYMRCVLPASVNLEPYNISTSWLRDPFRPSPVFRSPPKTSFDIPAHSVTPSIIEYHKQEYLKQQKQHSRRTISPVEESPALSPTLHHSTESTSFRSDFPQHNNHKSHGSSYHRLPSHSHKEHLSQPFKSQSREKEVMYNPDDIIRSSPCGSSTFVSTSDRFQKHMSTSDLGPGSYFNTDKFDPAKTTPHSIKSLSYSFKALPRAALFHHDPDQYRLPKTQEEVEKEKIDRFLASIEKRKSCKDEHHHLKSVNDVVVSKKQLKPRVPRRVKTLQVYD